MDKRISNTLSFVLGIVLFGFLIWKVVGIDKIILTFQSFSYINLIFIFILGVLLVIPSSLIWDKVLKLNGMYIKLSDVINISFAGDAISYLTPSAYFGGEPLRCWIMKKKYGFEASRVLPTILIEKFFKLSSYFFCGMVGLLFIFTEYYLPPAAEIFLAIGASFGILVYLFLFITIFNGHGFLTVFLKYLKLNKIKYIQKKSAKIANFDYIISDFFSRHKKELFKQFLLALTMVAISFLRYYIIIRSFGYNPSFFDILIIFSFTMFAVLIPFVPGSLGTLEAILVFVFALLYHNPGLGIVVAFMIRFSDSVRVTYGLISFVRYRLKFANKG